jgi:DNA-binding protein H-NS
MATLAALKKQMAALEAKMAKATKAEMGGAIAKVHKIMADFGLTIEHLASSGSRFGAAATKVSAKKQPAAKDPATKSPKPPKYRDPATGVTWSGVGRAPGWISNSKSRDEFLIAKPPGPATVRKATAAKRAEKPVASVKSAMAAAAEKKAARKAPAAKKSAAAEVAPASTPAKNARPKKDATKKASGKTVQKKATSEKSIGAPSAAQPTSEASGG